MPADQHPDAKFGLRVRLAAVHHTRVDRIEAPHETIAAARIDLARAIVSPDVRRALIHSFVAASMLEHPRADRTGS